MQAWEKMENKEIKKQMAKLGITSRLEQDRETAQNTPENVMPNIPGVFVSWKTIKNRPYAYLMKTYRIGDITRTFTLRYYGTKAPRKR